MADAISIVIPLYNKAATISRAIESVLAQTISDFELIVVDDGSTDESMKNARKMTDRRLRIVGQRNGGESAARNRGVDEATNELVAFLDADDEWRPGFLDAIVGLRQAFPDCALYATSYELSDGNGQLRAPFLSGRLRANWAGVLPNYVTLLQSELPFNASSVAVNRSSLRGVGGFPEGVSYNGDVATWIRLSYLYKFAFINKALSIYHREAKNRMSSQYAVPITEQFSYAAVLRLLEAGQVPKGSLQASIEYVARRQLPLAKERLHFGENRQARQLLRSCHGTRRYAITWALLYIAAVMPPRLYQRCLAIKHKLQGIRA